MDGRDLKINGRWHGRDKKVLAITTGASAVPMSESARAAGTIAVNVLSAVVTKQVPAGPQPTSSSHSGAAP